jgi:hypothetical protein
MMHGKQNIKNVLHFFRHPTDLPPKQLFLFCLLQEQLKAEEDSLVSIRQMENEVS